MNIVTMKRCVSVVSIVCFLSFSWASLDNKRLVLHSDVDIGQAIQALRQDNEVLRQDNLALTAIISNLTASLKAEIDQLNRSMKAESHHTIQVMKNDSDQKIQTLKNESDLKLQALKNESDQKIQALKNDSDQKLQALKNESDQRAQAMKSENLQNVQAMEIEIRSLQQSRGSTYVRWGRTVCPGNGTQKVYSGYAGGSPYELDGGAASYLCLPEHPTWGYYQDGIQDIGGYMSGGEYQLYEPYSSGAFGKHMLDEDAPCVVCEIPRPRVIMIPGSTQCYPGWSVEYTGYLMTGYKSNKGGTDYACLDVQPEAVLHGEASQDGKLFHFTEVKCGSLPCQEYPEGRELACTVCSK